MALLIARGWYFIVGVGTIGLVLGHVMGAASGSAFDPMVVAGGTALGLLALAAAAFVRSRSGVRRALAWLGILALLLPFADLLVLALSTARDAVGVAVVPSLAAIAAAVVMAQARRRADLARA